MGLPDDFLSRLLDEDDWSFIIKSVAFVEAILSNAITASVNDSRIADAVSRLFLRDKLRFAKSLGLVHKDGAKFIDKLADMRNAAAHDIHAMNFCIVEFLNRIQDSEREATIKALAYFAAAEDLSSVDSKPATCGRFKTSHFPRLKIGPYASVASFLLFCCLALSLSR